MDAAAARIDTELGDEPDVALALHRIMAGTYMQLRRTDKGVYHARREVALLRQLHAPVTEVAAGLHDLGSQLRNSGRADSGLLALREAYALLEQAGFPETVNLVRTMNELGLSLWTLGRPREAAPYLQRGLEVSERLGADTLTIVLASNLGNVQFAIGDVDGAEASYRKSGALLGSFARRETVERAAVLNNLTTVFILQGKFDEAERTIKEGLGVLERTVGPTNERVAISRVHLARIELATGRASQALETVRSAAAMLSHLRPQHPERARAENYEAAILLALGRLAEAETLARRALDTRRLVGAPTDWRIAETEAILGRILLARGAA